MNKLNIREKWCDILENLLECPVCLQIPDSYIYQCMSGHHICKTCRFSLLVCPICQRTFSDARNYLAEALSIDFKDIKTSIMCPTHKINKICVYTQTHEISKASIGVQIRNILLKKDEFIQTNEISKASIGVQIQSIFLKKDELTQTHEISKASIGVQIQSIFLKKDKFTQTEEIQISKLIQTEKKKKKLQFPRTGKGIYQCRISFCISLLSYGKLIQHLKDCHKDVYYIFQERNGIFKKNYKLAYNVPRCHDVALLIKYMGLFFVNIKILPTGDVAGAILAANNVCASKQFMFELSIGRGKTATMYTGLVQTCRVSRGEAIKNSFYKTNLEMQKVIHRDGMFSCSLSIKRSNLTEIKTLHNMNNRK